MVAERIEVTDQVGKRHVVLRYAGSGGSVTDAVKATEEAGI